MGCAPAEQYRKSLILYMTLFYAANPGRPDLCTEQEDLGKTIDAHSEPLVCV